ncbi:hypothetical protein BO70DRAFT_360968 [Aspergillus heteromorphus CBS 117.55]|uniref:RING-type domain-containing protein n=1 Tax=Aspergillus heteromorphus CBS 117.55 TaxID=1448321 RepID=A0A317WI43_9EURO|nr:uncharacterized protein BO70DRAFT_360968 [Aspergillus heteromorphus CBS 117.55]PWY86154.1 hypothetical protein BO70DRAFT_360968 [Aspergillus heteromorphus CBS 117.55]
MSRSTPAGAALSNGSDKTNAPKLNTGDNSSGLFQTLQGHVDDIRSLIQCGVCIRPLYEPYTLACGHTFCYSCLTSWFVGGRQNKTCPDCRAPVKAQPAPAYLVRTIVQMFTSRPELLDKGETTDEHRRHQCDEAERLEKDKQSTHPREGGLFRGTFNKSRLPPAQPIVDLEDNVVRCPRCSWELEEDANCAQCGYRQDDDSAVTDGSDWSDSEENSEMTDYVDADELEDGFGDADDYGWDEYRDGPRLDLRTAELDQLYRQWYGLAPGDLPPPRVQGPPRRQDYYHWPSGVSSAHEEDSEMDDEDDEDMDSFIDDDVERDDYSESDSSTVIGPHEFSITHTTIFGSESFDEMTDDSEIHDDESHDDDEDDDDDDEDDEPVRPPVNAMRRHRPPVYRVPSSSSDRENEPSTRSLSRSARPSGSNTQAPSRGDYRSAQQPSVGSSSANAISVDDESEEEPVRPTRRARGRGHCRYSAR